ncbi:MAG: hypothetical protein MUC50_20985 [Myxococcota bacterium]|jgi:hypothetical protein|nr:hypothetical protein [Myxococcota bacterium]
MSTKTAKDSHWNLVERERLITYKSKTILIDDFTHLQGSEFARIVLLHRDSAIARDKYEVLNLIDVTGSSADRLVLSALKKTATDTAKYYKKAAVIGLQGVTRVFLIAVNSVSHMGVEPFETQEQALEWLVETRSPP